MLFATIIVSCGGGGVKYPKMLSFTPASVMIDYSSSDLHQATCLAQQFCSSINKDAQYVRTERNDSMFGSNTRHGFFNCIERAASAPNGGHGAASVPIINNFRYGDQ